MKTLLLSLLFTATVPMTSLLTNGSKADAVGTMRTPVLIELFTSEGCSSCPPADTLLQKLDQQPIAGAELIVLSEHVDYWNHIGWKDPYSARLYSERQSAYGKRFGLDSVYTPQMVVDGMSEFVGGNTSLANQAFETALHRPKLPVRLSSISVTSHLLTGHLETGSLDKSYGTGDADVYLVLALNRAESRVSAGENAGHNLQHVSVVRRISKIGAVKQGQALSQEVQVKVGPGEDSDNLRLIAFVQESQQGRVLGAAAVRVNAR
ncbi:MAG TPA: DUF1223 domain-containing protein [Terriglobales bacterium]|nr:DUF1223 domain-containing protein [Terriglobales bacterium]